MNMEAIKRNLINYLVADMGTNKMKYRVIAAAIDNHNHIITVGRNSYVKTHPLQAKHAAKDNSNRKYIHAEISSLVKSRRNPVTMVVVRMTKTGKIRMARPCPICTMAMKEAGIKSIHWTDNDGGLQNEKIYKTI